MVVVKWLLEKAVAIVIMLAVFAWWTLTGGGDYASEVVMQEELPSVVDGGGRQVSVELSTSEPVRFVASFECATGNEDSIFVGGEERLEAGVHNLSFDVAGDCWWAILEVAPDETPVGASMSWNVSIEGQPFHQEELTLDGPLAPNTAFFLQTGWEDLTLDEIVEWNREHG